MMPATNVPCPSVSMHGSPPTKLRASAMRPWKSGSEQSMPESTIATFTGASVVGGSAHASKAWSSWRYHCFGASGSAGVNAAAGAADRERGERRATARRGASVRHDLRRRRPGARSPSRGRPTRGTSPPDASATGSENVPSVLTMPLATVVQVPSGFCCCTCTGAAGSTGCSEPAICVVVNVVTWIAGATRMRTNAALRPSLSQAGSRS